MIGRKPVSFLTVLPFVAALLAQDFGIHTRIEDDGTGLRSIDIVADKERGEQVLPGAAELLPHLGWCNRRMDTVSTGDSFRVSGNVRFTKPNGLDGVRVVRRTRFGGWPPIATTYEYTDTVKRSGFEGNEAETAAAPKTEYTYSVRMPGNVDDTSVRPAGGLVTGRTVTWKLNAGKEKVEVAVSSADAHWAPVILVAAILLVGGASGSRYVLVRLRNKPRHI